MKTVIIFSIFALAVIALTAIIAVLNSKLNAARTNFKELRDTLDGYLETQANPETASYRIHIEEDGTAFVYRHAITQNGRLWICQDTKIKDFTDEDADYNRICAEELCDHLNEEI